MADLSHYDLFTAFTLEEAAHLACGIDPKSGLSNTATATVEEAMRDGLNFWRGSCGIYAATQSDFAARVPDWVLRPTSLWPMFDSMFVPFKTEKDAWKSLNEDVFQNNDLTFSREELDRWFKAKGLGLKTQYEFVQRSTKQSPEAPSERPMSERERASLLRIIGALVEHATAPGRRWPNQAALIEELVASYGADKEGISKSGLETKFAEAKRRLHD